MDLLDFVALFLAAGAVVNAWMKKDGLFAGWRDWLAIWGDQSGWRWFFATLLNCRVCLTYHAAFWLMVVFYLPSHFWLSPPWAVVWFLPVYSLAATRLSLLIGSLTASLPIENDPEND